MAPTPRSIGSFCDSQAAANEDRTEGGEASSVLLLAEFGREPMLRWIADEVLPLILLESRTEGRTVLGRIAHEQGDGPSYHRHEHQDEILLLLAGTAVVWFDGERHQLEEGAAAYLPREKPHSYRVTSKTADLLMINACGALEGMFRRRAADLSLPR